MSGAGIPRCTYSPSREILEAFKLFMRDVSCLLEILSHSLSIPSRIPTSAHLSGLN